MNSDNKPWNMKHENYNNLMVLMVYNDNSVRIGQIWEKILAKRSNEYSRK